MPQLEISLSGLVREKQTDTKPAAEFSLEIKDSSVTEYDGAKRITVEATKSLLIDTSFMSAPSQYLSIVLLEGTAINVQLRKENTTANDIQIGRFFFAEVKNLEQIKLYNSSDVDVVARIFLVGGTP